MMIASLDAIKVIGQHQDNVVIVSTMSTSREWPLVAKDQQLHIPMGSAMGKASSLALGIALAKPDRRVYLLDGDGSLLMNLGTMVTIAHAAPANLVHFVFENGVYAITGGQPVPGAGRVDFEALALAAGYRTAYTFDNLHEFERVAGWVVNEAGPVMVVLKVKTTDNSAPWPRRSPVQVIRELQQRLAGAS